MASEIHQKITKIIASIVKDYDCLKSVKNIKINDPDSKVYINIISHYSSF